MDNIIISTRGLAKTFRVRQGMGGKPQDVQAVRGIDLTVRAGEVFGFLGPNGAGKSTTLRMLTTLMPPTAGEGWVAGHDLLKQPKRVRERIGYVSQAGGSDPNATGRENLLLQAQLTGASRADADARTNALLGALELESFADRMVKTYSGGQRRRLDLALGMINQPLVLFLDEPTTGLDPQSRARLWDEVRRLREGGTTVFLTTHYLEEADVLADRLAIIDDGRIVAEGTPQALKQQISGDVVTLRLASANGAIERARTMLMQQPFVRDTLVNADQLQLFVDRGDETLPALLRLLDEAHMPVQAVALARPTLDDVFLRKTGRSLRDVNN